MDVVKDVYFCIYTCLCFREQSDVNKLFESDKSQIFQKIGDFIQVLKLDSKNTQAHGYI